jgi:hypothetical protein
MDFASGSDRLSLSYPLNANDTQDIMRFKSRDSFQKIEEDVSRHRIVRERGRSMHKLPSNSSMLSLTYFCIALDMSAEMT